jgi:hypothetical protein
LKLRKRKKSVRNKKEKIAKSASSLLSKKEKKLKLVRPKMQMMRSLRLTHHQKITKFFKQ